ncbi:MAG: phenylacetate--CoA ligase, partial [Coprobacter sp.]|nr:phenylacetate--CoA ligase [Coprobacter sp.]
KTIEMRDRLARRLQSVLSISADVKIVSPNTLERSVGKSKRVIDNRVLE